uniref:Uncharacterized protein n=1 Tax=Trichogramma kaykai TaxID=54128 RepID=A0ABD2W834_9HYME
MRKRIINTIDSSNFKATDIAKTTSLLDALHLIVQAWGFVTDKTARNSLSSPVQAAKYGAARTQASWRNIDPRRTRAVTAERETATANVATVSSFVSLGKERKN